MSNINDWQLLLTFLMIAGAQFIAILLVLTINIVAWYVRRNRFAYLFFGIYSIIPISYYCLLYGFWWEFGVHTWFYTIILAGGFLFFVVGVTFLHRWQFGLPLAAGFFGFCFEAVASGILFDLMTQFERYWTSWPWFYANVEFSKFQDAFWITYIILWLLLTFFRPTLLHFWQSFHHQFASWKNPTSAN